MLCRGRALRARLPERRPSEACPGRWLVRVLPYHTRRGGHLERPRGHFCGIGLCAGKREAVRGTPRRPSTSAPAAAAHDHRAPHVPCPRDRGRRVAWTRRGVCSAIGPLQPPSPTGERVHWHGRCSRGRLWTSDTQKNSIRPSLSDPFLIGLHVHRYGWMAKSEPWTIFPRGSRPWWGTQWIT